MQSIYSNCAVSMSMSMSTSMLCLWRWYTSTSVEKNLQIPQKPLRTEARMGSSSSKSEVQEVLRAGWLKALEAGTWGPAGDADVDFPVGTPEGLLYNPKSECQRRLQGKDAKVVGEACSKANQWLANSHAKTGAAELVLSQLQREPKPRPLVEAEKSTARATLLQTVCLGFGVSCAGSCAVPVL